MKIKNPHKISFENHKLQMRSEAVIEYDPVVEWDTLCKNVKNFWVDLFEDISE
jgi:hypothetical protein